MAANQAGSKPKPAMRSRFLAARRPELERSATFLPRRTSSSTAAMAPG